MQHDIWGMPVTTREPAAACALGFATLALLAQRDDAGHRFTAALAADSGLVAAQGALGLLHLASGRRPRQAEALRCLAAARAAFVARGGTARESALLTALGAWAEQGDMWRAAELLEEALRGAPADPLLFRLAYAIRFMLGDAVGMRLASALVLDAMPAEAPGRAYLRGCLAFTLGETGEPWRAECEGRLAVAQAPDDLWGAHAVAHVMEREGRARDGIDWLERTARGGLGAAAFSRHLFWHRALFHLHLGEGEAALRLYDTEVWRDPGSDFRDLANAASLLWRLESQGVPPGAARWDELADEAERRLGEHCLAFADLHHAVALGAAGRRSAAARLLRGMRLRAIEDGDTQAQVMGRVGLAVARGVVTALLGDPGEAAALLRAHRSQVQALGGSNAQRDLVERVTIDAMLAAGDAETAFGCLLERDARRAGGSWEAQRSARIRGVSRKAPHPTEPSHPAPERRPVLLRSSFA
jgi:tetratricopeptide (TPR) repeat protein